jgi:arylsulfatase A-like enzyme
VQLDWCVGQILAALDRHKLTQNTLVIFTSDNGPVVDDGYEDGAVENLNGHTPAGTLRGGKYSAYEAGTRVPFVASWPARIKRGVSDALISQIDLPASLSALAGRAVPGGAAPDSMNLLPALLGESRKGRDHLVEQSARGIALRRGKWKLMPKGVEPRSAAGLPTRTEDNPLELYDLSKDLSERADVAAGNPQVVAEMTAMLEKIRTQ